MEADTDKAGCRSNAEIIIFIYYWWFWHLKDIELPSAALSRDAGSRPPLNYLSSNTTKSNSADKMKVSDSHSVIVVRHRKGKRGRRRYHTASSPRTSSMLRVTQPHEKSWVNYNHVLSEDFEIPTTVAHLTLKQTALRRFYKYSHRRCESSSWRYIGEYGVDHSDMTLRRVYLRIDIDRALTERTGTVTFNL